MTTTRLSSLGPAMAKLELHFLLNLSRCRLSLFLNLGLFFNQGCFLTQGCCLSLFLNPGCFQV